MYYKKIVIETDGTSMGTKVFVDGVFIGKLQKFEFSADVKENFVVMNGLIARENSDGTVKTRKTKVRDQKTEKFHELQEIETEPLQLERALEKVEKIITDSNTTTFENLGKVMAKDLAKRIAK